MAKKQITNYKFFPGVIPPSFGQYPNAITSIRTNKNYIIQEAIAFLQFATATPLVAPTAYPNAIALLTNNKNFIVEEANAWVLNQISTNTAPFVGYPYGPIVQAKCKRDIGYLVDAWISDLTGGGNADTIRIARTYHRNGIAQLLSPVQEAAVYSFLKTLINSYVLTLASWSTLQSPVVAAQNTVGSAGEAAAITRVNTLVDIVIAVIPGGLVSLPAISYNYNATFVGYTYDESKCVRDIEYVLDSYLYDLTYGGNSSTYYTASRYYINGVIQINNPDVEVQSQSFIKTLITDFILTNTLAPSYQLTIQQSTSTVGIEGGSILAVGTLADIVINVIDTGLTTLPAPVAPSSQGGTLMSSAVTLLERNKRFIQEEAIAYIQFNIDNNIAPYIFYTYNAEKCRRDISYILEGYISDFKNGGNYQTHFNASRYWVSGVAQVDGDRQPEIFAHTFIRNLISNFVWTNTPFSARQTLVSQTIDNSINVEVFAKTRLTELSNTILDVIENGPLLLPVRISNKGYLKIPGFYKLKDFLLITNATRNQIMYNFADTSAAAEVTYTEDFDPDFPGALYGVDKITTLVFAVDTSSMMITDNIQIFIESKEQEIKMNRSAQDAMERVKVGIPQSMLDADFEYGLQPTKWQAIGMMRNYPSIYEIPSSDIPIASVVTNASVTTGGVGASLITVTTQSLHGLVAGDGITIKALSNSVLGFSRAEGSFLVVSAPTPTTFTYFAKSKVGTTNGEVLASTYTQLRKGGFYTNSSVGNPTFSVFSSGSSGTITTSLITLADRNIIGFSGSPPPIGAPLTGTGIRSGSQVTSVAGSGGIAASTQLLTPANIGDTSLVVVSTTGIGAGLVFDRGDGVAVAVTNVVGNTVSLSGALTSTILGSSETYSNRSQTSTSGSGTGAVFDVSRNGLSYSATVATAGNSYSINDTITISGLNLGGASPTNNATITVTSASLRNTVSTLNEATLVNGLGYTSGNNLPTTSSLGSGLTVDITTVGSNGAVSSISINNSGGGYSVGDVITVNNTVGKVISISFASPTGSGYTSNQFNTTGGSGTGLTVSVVANIPGTVLTVTLTNPGTSGYVNGIVATTTTGSGFGCSLIIETNGSGVITSAVVQTGGQNYSNGDILTITGGSNDATVTVQTVTNGEITSISISNPGSGYSNNDIINISGGNNNASFTVNLVSSLASIQVGSVSPGGAIQTISIAGTPISAPTRNFISAFTLSETTTAQIASSNTGITFSSIATIQATFTNAHGFVPGNAIVVAITSTGAGAQLAAGPYFVEQVPDANTLRYTARAPGAIDNNLVGVIYGRPDSYFIHRPFDGGVMLGTAGPSHGAQAIRMSKKYIRYQSGKGVMYNTGALFAPSYDIRSLTATGTAVGSVITLVTDDVDHGCQVGGVIRIVGAVTAGYDGTYTVTNIVNERQLTVIANKTLAATTASLGNPCVMSIQNWHGATVRSGIFDDQNGMFWQYDGIRMAVVKRSSTFQIAGTIAIAANSNLVTGTNTRFTDQLTAGDRIVIRGMSHVVSQITSDTQMFVTPDFRGVSNITEAKIVKTIDLMIPQEDWNLDSLNGAGPSGYVLDPTKMQMIGIQHTWYGAGFVDFMLRGSDGNYCWAHRIRNSNVNTEAYMRTGNQPVRYEVTNEGAKSRLSAAMDANQTFIPLETAYWFPTSGTVIIDNELIRYTGNTGTQLTGCTRSAGLTQFAAGSQRTFTGGPAATHAVKAGVILVSNTITPIISHWGSAFMIDGQFDSDRGYIFNYAATGISASTERSTAFLIRLAPSVSNAQTGDLGEKELLNRAQLLLSSISITSDAKTTGGTPADIVGGIVVEGVLNPSNYPTDPTKITWTGLQSPAQGGQPSFAQVASGGSVSWGAAVVTTTATVQGAFTTTLTAKAFNIVTNSLTALSFTSPITQTITAWGFFNNTQPWVNPTYNNALSSGRTDFLIQTSEFDALTTSLSVGDTLSAATFLTNSQTILSITRNFQTVNNTSFTRIVMNRTASSTSNAGFGNNVTITVTSVLPSNYSAAISASRNDFLVTNAQAATVQVQDPLSATTVITGSQTISSITPSFVRISGTNYARIVMTSNGTATSVAGNTVTITATASATATYNRALSTTRSDFLVTDAQFTGSGIQTSDTLSATTSITGGQSILSITPGFITIGGVSHTRIVMSAVANANSIAGAGNDIAVTITAAGTEATYTNKNFIFFTGTSWLASGATFGTKVDTTTVTQFPAGTAVVSFSTRTFGAITVYRVTFSQTATGSFTAAGTVTFAFGANYALPGEQVFSFIANPGETAELSLEALKELTATTIGGRGTFPNGPDVLAINVYKVSGAAAPCSVILRWGEAQA